MCGAESTAISHISSSLIPLLRPSPTYSINNPRLHTIRDKDHTHRKGGVRCVHPEWPEDVVQTNRPAVQALVAKESGGTFPVISIGGAISI